MNAPRFHTVIAHVARASLVMLCLLASGCHLGPAYRLPAVPTTPSYEEKGPSLWKTAEPKDGAIRGRWWQMFQDPQLNALEERVDAGNQNIAAAIARYDAARAVVRQTRSQYFPTVTTTPALSNSRVAVVPYTVAASGTTYTEYSFPVTASWEPDFWGRVRKNVQVNAYTAQSSAADMENVRLLAHADLASDYFQLRGVEAQKEILDSTLMAWQKYLSLTRGLMKSGLATEEAVAAAESQLKAAQAQDTNLDIARAQYEHAIAVLLGKPPSAVSLPAATKDVHLPQIPIGVPAELLERRPDIATTERAIAAANAQIGVARTAYFPNVLLSATGGIESLSFADWFAWPSRFWSIGPAAMETLLDSGLRRATAAQYRAMYDESVANYRQTALTAFQQVEDNLAALRILSQDLQEQDAAVQSARRYVSQAMARNTAGLDPYLNVLTAQVSLLVYQQTYVGFQTQQKLATVQLIEALGGGWETTKLPSPKQASH
ncbi:efflux transporter outer membrane subunit [Edaphobacter paludis]|uniref:Efflux transporter outer membrane subunit n=1 Tax=Edaphobacter paludis TaxID=3035702 RepID=A0AAU7DBE4_9BACT